jgi:deoxyribodipyrimidine photolyase-related protein
MYILHGTRMRMGNFFNHTNKLPKSWWHGTTGIPPVDTTIRRALTTAYSHHIERLMVAGGRMVLDEVDPNDAYRWFMEMYIDAYDWVMVPNVYGMSQFADGGIFATKPYISGSNYIIKMSDYKKGDWSIEWDALFWKFLHKHRDFFMKNPRMRMLLAAKKK